MGAAHSWWEPPVLHIYPLCSFELRSVVVEATWVLWNHLHVLLTSLREAWSACGGDSWWMCGDTVCSCPQDLGDSSLLNVVGAVGGCCPGLSAAPWHCRQRPHIPLCGGCGEGVGLLGCMLFSYRCSSLRYFVHFYLYSILLLYFPLFLVLISDTRLYEDMMSLEGGARSRL